MAESYLSNAIFELNKRGDAENIDVSEEVRLCEELIRAMHSKKGVASREKKYVL